MSDAGAAGQVPSASVRVMRLRYRGVCEVCGAQLPAGATAVYDRERRKVRCVECPATENDVETAVRGIEAATEAPDPAESGPPVVPAATGMAGGSAQRIYERRSARDRARQEARVAGARARREKAKAEHPILGRIASAIVPKEVIGPEPQHITAWKTGAEGEQRVGARLDDWAAAEGGIVLHDRRKPGSKANIDHIAVAASGIYVIDAKRYEGKVEAVDVGGWFRTDIRLKVAGRDRTKLTGGVGEQVATVASVLAGAWPHEVRPSVYGVLCFIDSLWAWRARPFEVNDVIVAWPAATVEILERPGSWTPAEMAEVGSALAAALRSA
ncbi:MAG: NERD domain-containing protein [Acidobacteriota bacterium]|nr:NERD domain-containing protein [Acidobacteriota bacterium]